MNCRWLYIGALFLVVETIIEPRIVNITWIFGNPQKFVSLHELFMITMAASELDETNGEDYGG